MILTIIIFIVILGVLIFVHELGHFLVAKRNGVRVDEFGFGFPPRIFGIKRGETIYSINAIPLGGFVKIYGEEGEGVNSSRSFASKKAWQKTKILFAGVMMNFILAVFLFSLGNVIGLPSAIEENQISQYPNAKLQIVAVNHNSPAASAGLQTGDFVSSVKNSEGKIIEGIKKPSDFQAFVDSDKGREMTIVVQRGDSNISVSLVPRADPPTGQGPLGVELATVTRISLPWYKAIWEGFMTTINLIWMLLVALFQLVKNLIVSGRAGVDVVGPIGIYTLTNQAATLGFIYLLQLTAILSINLAVINAFPFPALDGGRALFLMIEKIKGSSINQKTQNLIHTIGFALLILLMVAITYRDIIRFF